MLETPTREPDQEPYLGPEPYKPKDAYRFFGRDVESYELYSLMVANQLVLLYAESGAGKSSLLAAGVEPHLHERGFEILGPARVLDPAPDNQAGGDGNAYGRALLTSLGAEGTPSSLASWLRQRERPRGTPRALMVDQFEEFFTVEPGHPQDRQEFVDDLVKAIDEDPLLRVVLALREDYLASFDPIAAAFAERWLGRYRLRRLDREAALAAVSGPLKRVGWRFAPGVAERLVQDLQTVPVEVAPGRSQQVVGEFVEPMQLQVVCRRLWRGVAAGGRGPEDHLITEADAAIYGDVTRALTELYEQALQAAVSEAGESERALRSWFAKRLITEAGTRGIVHRGEHDTEGIRNQAVDVLVRERVLRGDRRAGTRWYELTHDRLIKPIIDSNTSFEKESRERVAVTAPGIVSGKGLPVWRELALTRIKELEALASWMEARVDATPARTALADAARNHLAVAREAVNRGGTRIPGFGSGSWVERAQANIDAATVAILQYGPLEDVWAMLPELTAVVVDNLWEGDPRREVFERIERHARTASLTEVDRGRVVAAVRAAYNQRESTQLRLQAFRNVVRTATVLMLLVFVVATVAAAVWPWLAPLCFASPGRIVCPAAQETFLGGVTDQDVARLASGWDYVLVGIMGLLGAAVSATLSLRQVRGTSEPYGLLVAVAILKLPTGMVTALVGLLLVRGGFVPGFGAFDSSAQVLALAVLFGFAQQWVTRSVDQQAHAVLDAASTAADLEPERHGPARDQAPRPRAG